MKYLIFSDMHFHNWPYGSTILKNGFNSRLVFQLNVIMEIKRCAEQEKGVEKIVFLGDLFHTPGKIDTHVLAVASEALKLLSETVSDITFLVGNHDFGSKNGFVHALRWAPGEVISNWSCHGDSYLSYNENKEEVQEALNRTPEGGLCFLHQGVSNLPVGSGFVIPNEVLSEDMIPSHVKRVFTGHYHKPWDGAKLHVVGSPMQHNWGDADDTPRGWIIYDDETDEVTRFESSAPKFIKIDYSLPLKVTMEYENIKNCYIRISNYSGPTDFMRKQLLERGALSVEFEVKTEQQVIDKIEVESFDLDPMIAKYAKANKADKKLIKVGQDIRSGAYENSISSS